jgi:hypothetical protein
MTEINNTADVIARPSTGFRIKHSLISLMLIGMGLWFAYDGFVNWPNQNRQAPAGTKAPHTDLDIMIQKILAGVLPPVGLFMLISTFYRSRGQYQLSGTTLRVPGHPPVPLDNMRRIDKRLWDRKGIAYIDYEIPDTQQTATLKLDDFVYERAGTDEIFKRIETYLLPVETPAPAQTESTDAPQ